MGATAPGGAVLWCRHCDQPARRAGGGDGPLGKVVHAGTGEELGADGHPAVPTDVSPELAAVAARVEADEPDYVVVVTFGFLLRATLRGAVTPVPLEGTTEDEIRRKIVAQKSMRQLAAR